MERTLDASAARDVYALMTALVVPRPIAWISTKAPTGPDADDDVVAAATNLAPFSYFNAVCSDPPMLSVSIADARGGAPKDTLRLLRETGVFCVNLVEAFDLDRMHQTSASLPAGQSEAVAGNIALTRCVAIDGVRVSSSRAALECRVVDVHRYGRGAPVHLVIGEVVHAFVDDGLLDAQGAVVGDRVDPVARLGGTSYGLLGARPQRARPR